MDNEIEIIYETIERLKMTPDTLFLLHGMAGIVAGGIIAWSLSH